MNREPSPSALPRRRYPEHGVNEQSIGPTIVYLTICSKDRVPWLAMPEHHSIFREIWQNATAWLVGRYVIMPDHIHLFAGPGFGTVNFDSWVQYWKSKFTKRHCPTAGKWQPNHWDTRLRRSDSYNEKSLYVWNNPVRHGLVKNAEDWPFKGELFHLPW